MVIVTDDIGVAYTDTGSITNWAGLTVTANMDLVLLKVALETGVTADMVYVYNWTDSVLVDSASVTSLEATFNTALLSTKEYLIVAGKVGYGSYTRYYKDGAGLMPIVGTNITFVRAAGRNSAGEAWTSIGENRNNVVAITTISGMKVNISDAWEQMSGVKVNIGDVWKDVVAVKQNVGDVWKDV